MLNYVNAEFYKLRHKKSLFVGMGILLLLESFLLLSEVPEGLTGEVLPLLFFMLRIMMPVGLFLAPIFSALVFDDQYGRSTLKNEIVYGIPRSRIYLGKLLAAALAGTEAAGLVMAWYCLLCILLARSLPPAAICLEMLMAAVGSWFTWLAALAFTFFLLFTLKSASGAFTITYVLSVFGIPMSITVAKFEDTNPFLYWFGRLYYTSPYYWLTLFPPQGGGWSSASLWIFAQCALIGLGWLVVCSALGLAIFYRREIR